MSINKKTVLLLLFIPAMLFAEEGMSESAKSMINDIKDRLIEVCSRNISYEHIFNAADNYMPLPVINADYNKYHTSVSGTMNLSPVALFYNAKLANIEKDLTNVWDYKTRGDALGNNINLVFSYLSSWEAYFYWTVFIEQIDPDVQKKYADLIRLKQLAISEDINRLRSYFVNEANIDFKKLDEIDNMIQQQPEISDEDYQFLIDKTKDVLENSSDPRPFLIEKYMQERDDAYLKRLLWEDLFRVSATYSYNRDFLLEQDTHSLNFSMTSTYKGASFSVTFNNIMDQTEFNPTYSLQLDIQKFFEKTQLPPSSIAPNPEVEDIAFKMRTLIYKKRMLKRLIDDYTAKEVSSWKDLEELFNLSIQYSMIKYEKIFLPIRYEILTDWEFRELD